MGTRADGLEQNLRRSWLDGIFCCVMVGAGEHSLAAFGLALGVSAAAAGLIPTLPMLAGALLALLAPRGVRALGSLKRWVWISAAVQACAFVPLALGAAAGRYPGWGVFAAAILYWSAGLACGSAWNTWITTLVPGPIRAQYFGRRTRALQLAQLAAVLAAGALLHLGDERGRELWGFAAVFALAALARWTSAAYLAAHSEPVALPSGYRLIPPAELLRSLTRERYGRWIAYLFALQFSVQLASPYFTPYMLRELELGYGTFMALLATVYLGKVACLPWHARMARTRGPVALLRRASWTIALVAVPWLLSDALPVLFLAQLAAGAAWSAFELAIYLLFFEHASEAERASVLSLYNLTNAMAFTLGSLGGAWLLAQLAADRSAYLWVFGASTALRMGTCLALLRPKTGSMGRSAAA
jgi:MFS family permease